MYVCQVRGRQVENTRVDLALTPYFAGLPKARTLLEDLKSKYPEVSYADLYQMASAVAVEVGVAGFGGTFVADVADLSSSAYSARPLRSWDAPALRNFIVIAQRAVATCNVEWSYRNEQSQRVTWNVGSCYCRRRTCLCLLCIVICGDGCG